MNMKILQKVAKALWINTGFNKYSYQNFGEHLIDTLIKYKQRLPN